jgi:hypothetical protein
MSSRMASSSLVLPEVALVLSHQYLDFQTPLYILAQIQSAIINQQIKLKMIIEN